MTKRNLEQMVAAGEGQRLEFKHRLPEDERIAREITALANTYGGDLLIGVTDEGYLRGLKDYEEELYALNRALEKYCTPRIDLEFEYVKVSRKRYAIVVKVPISSERPHYVLDESTRRKSVFVRFQDMCIEASPEARKLMSEESITENSLIKLGEKERLLFKQLEKADQITVRGFAKHANIHPGRASRIIVRMTRAGILNHHISLDDDYFTAGNTLSSNSGM